MSCFDIKDKIDHTLYSGYNLYSRLNYCCQFRARKIIQENKVFQNKHFNERCFILGTGPSLKKISPVEIDFLKKEKIIGVNFLYLSSFLADIIPDYYFLMDNAFWQDRIKDTRDIIKFYEHKKTLFFTGIEAFPYLNSFNSIQKKIYFLYVKRYPNKFIDNCLYGNQTIAMNVVGQAIMAAMFMGFKEIYLLGCDYTAFATPVEDHCYDSDNSSKVILKKNNLGFMLKYYEITTRIHYYIEAHAVKNGVKIFNSTPGSLLDAYRRKELKHLL